jgi:hypothetical protein
LTHKFPTFVTPKDHIFMFAHASVPRFHTGIFLSPTKSSILENLSSSSVRGEGCNKFSVTSYCREEGPYSIRFMVLAPGPVADTEELSQPKPDGIDEFFDKVSAGCIGTIQEANVTVLLFSPAAAFIMGQFVIVISIFRC